VLNTFTYKRAPLYKLSEAYQGIDTEVLFGDGITHEQIADSAVGEALERLHAANAGKLFQTLCLSVYEHFGIPMKRMHSDTTSVSFYGNYEEEDYGGPTCQDNFLNYLRWIFALLSRVIFIHIIS
jgi:transposase